jgi:hypothetical protein
MDTVLGSTGNVYSVNIGQVPSCDCPDFARSSDACKHVLFVMTRVLRLSHSNPVIYQKALLQKELVGMLKTTHTKRSNNDHSNSAAATSSSYLGADSGVLANDQVRKQFLNMTGKKRKCDANGAIIVEDDDDDDDDDVIDVTNRRPIEAGDEWYKSTLTPS